MKLPISMILTVFTLPGLPEDLKQASKKLYKPEGNTSKETSV